MLCYTNLMRLWNLVMNITRSKVLATIFSRSGEKKPTNDPGRIENFTLAKTLQTVPYLMSKSEFRKNCQLPFVLKVIGTYCLQNIYQCFHCIVYHQEGEKIQNIIYITSNFEALCWHQKNNRLLHNSKSKYNISKSLPTPTNLHSYQKNTAPRPDSLRSPAGEKRLFFMQLHPHFAEVFHRGMSTCTWALNISLHLLAELRG